MFTAKTFQFLKQLEQNNNREWFEAHKADYETHVRTPALAFIEAMGLHLPRFAPHFRAEARKVGGSLMRVYRDTRFSKDKTPYKTNIGIQFRHEAGSDVHAPGFYLHISPDECFMGLGCWQPDPVMLHRIRTRIIEKTDAWRACQAALPAHFVWEVSALKNAPRGFAPDHVAVADLKRKDFAVITPITPQHIQAPDFVDFAAQQFEAGNPLMRFLCAAGGLPF